MTYQEHYQGFLELGYTPYLASVMAKKAVKTEAMEQDSPDYETLDLSNGLET